MKKKQLKKNNLGDKSREKSSTTPPDRRGDHQSTDPPGSRTQGKVGASMQHPGGASMQHPGGASMQHPGIVHQVPKFSVYPAHYAHLRKRAGR